MTDSITTPVTRANRRDYKRAEAFTGEEVPQKLLDYMQDLRNGTITWNQHSTATQNGCGAAGSAIEAAHGVVVNNKKTADYKGIELKSVNLDLSPALLTLFNKTPSHVVEPVPCEDDPSLSENERFMFVKKRGVARQLWEEYAYHSDDPLDVIDDGRKKKRLQQTIRVGEITCPSQNSIKYDKRHELTLRYRDEFIVLVVDGEEKAAWPEAIFKRISKLIYMVVWEAEQVGVTKVKGRKLPLFKLKNATAFWGLRTIKGLAESGTLSLDLRISQRNDAKKYHLPRDRGSAWRLKEAAALYKNSMPLIRDGVLLV